jgi:cystathionine gamma-synthase
LTAERQCLSATELVKWLDESIEDSGHPLHGLVRRVWHPSLPSSPGHEIALRAWPNAAKGWFGGTFALELHSEAAAKALPAALQLFKDATSLGGVEVRRPLRPFWRPL